MASELASEVSMVVYDVGPAYCDAKFENASTLDDG